MRLTDQQIRETVAAMKMSATCKAALLKQALEDKNPGARFVIFASWKKANRS